MKEIREIEHLAEFTIYEESSSLKKVQNNSYRDDLSWLSIFPKVLNNQTNDVL